jgi:hypothetical protein
VMTQAPSRSPGALARTRNRAAPRTPA